MNHASWLRSQFLPSGLRRACLAFLAHFVFVCFLPCCISRSYTSKSLKPFASQVQTAVPAHFLLVSTSRTRLPGTEHSDFLTLPGLGFFLSPNSYPLWSPSGPGSPPPREGSSLGHYCLSNNKRDSEDSSMNAPSHPIRCSQTWLTATSPRWKPHFSLLVRLPSICSRVVSLKQAWSSFPTSTFRLFFLSIVNKIFYIPRWTFEMPCARTFIIDGSIRKL